MFFPFIDNIVVFAGNGMVESFWEPHLKNSEAAATQYQVGLVFLVLGGSYTMTALPCGFVSSDILINGLDTDKLLVTHFFYE